MGMIRVDIRNAGKFMGVKTPVYNYPMDVGTYRLLLEMGFDIAPHAAKKQTFAAPTAETASKPISATAVQEKQSYEAWLDKDVYEASELEVLNRRELAMILNHRGHYSAQTGPRDPLAPKNADTRSELIDKIMKTNKAD